MAKPKKEQPIGLTGSKIRTCRACDGGNNRKGKKNENCVCGGSGKINLGLI